MRNVAFYAIVGAFWIYASFTRTAQWQLLREALPKWGIPSFEVQTLECALMFPLLVVLCAASRRFGYDFRDWRRLLPLHLSFATLFGLAGRPALIAAHALLQQGSLLTSIHTFDGTDPWAAARLYVSQALDEGFQYLVLQFILCGYSFYLRYLAEQSGRETLRLQYERARLRALRMRINPHFLYNTLSAIDGLVGRDPDAAKQMIAGLGELFRRTLADRDAEYIRLREELELAEQYLRIQKIRFSDRLSCDVRVAPELLDIEVPPLLLQPLLENAVAHGIGSSEGRVNIEVTCDRQHGGQVRVVVHNHSAVQSLAPGSAGTGLGLESTRERLQAAYGATATMDAHSPARGEFVVQLDFDPRVAVA
jgi:hypothetical protein